MRAASARPAVDELVLRGWGRAALAAAIVFLVVLLLNGAIAVLQYSAGRSFDAGVAGVPEVATAGDIPFTAAFNALLWHGVPMVGEAEVPFPGGGGAIGAEVSVALPLMLGLTVVALLLFRAGRAVAGPEERAWWLRAAEGAKVALPYALLMGVLALITSATLPIVPSGAATADAFGDLAMNPSPAGAVFRSLAIAVVAAGAGAAAGAWSAPGPRWSRLSLALIAGGWRMSWVTAALGTVGFLIVLAL